MRFHQYSIRRNFVFILHPMDLLKGYDEVVAFYDSKKGKEINKADLQDFRIMPVGSAPPVLRGTGGREAGSIPDRYSISLCFLIPYNTRSYRLTKKSCPQKRKNSDTPASLGSKTLHIC